MDALAGVAAVVVGLAFVLAGASKIALGLAWPAQAAEFGAPAWAARAVPWIELALGATLAVRVARPAPAVGAVAILILFSALIVRHLAAGRHPQCACFGVWSARPIGAGHLVRNGVLLALAVLALWA